MKLVLLAAVVIQVHCQQDYTIPLLGHGIRGETYNVNVLYQLYNQGISPTTSTTDDGTTISIPAGETAFHTMMLNETHLPTQSGLLNQTRTLSSSPLDADVLLQVITTVNGHSEGYQAIPNDRLGTEYYVSTFCALGGYCQIVIGSTVVGTTQVYVKLPAEVDEIGFCIKNGTWYSRSNTTITLIYPEVVQLETTHDLTGQLQPSIGTPFNEPVFPSTKGTRIYSDNPVAVIAGSRAATGSTPMYHLIEQLAPVPEWGTEFFVLPIGTNAYGNIVHITSRYRKTFVTMDGFPTVELTGFGRTVKRRIELGSAIRIKSTQPVQVMMYTGFTYASSETILNPGMTLVPATEHWKQQQRVVCQESVTTTDFLQLVHSEDDTVAGLASNPTTTRLQYDSQEFNEYNDAVSSTGRSLSGGGLATGTFSGIMFCQDSAIFPISPLLLPVGGVVCNPTPLEAFPGDGIDNNCGGAIDEDECYENRMFAADPHYIVNHTFAGHTSFNDSILDFTLFKFRLRSCGDVKIELPVNVTGSDAGRLVLSIAKEMFVIYGCFPACTELLHESTVAATHTSANCDTLVPYWIARYGNDLCMGVGPFPDILCSTPTVINVTNYVFTDVVLFGLHSDAVFYYDLYRADCGMLESDWRCDDLADNCWEYGGNLCTNPAYEDWVAIYCRKFCDVCSPDSAGRMFAVMPSSLFTGVTHYHVISRGATSLYNSVSSDKVYSFESVTATTQTGNTTDVMFAASVGSDVFVVYTSEEAELTATVHIGADAISMPIYPLDALGTEYMTLSFATTPECQLVSVDGYAEAWANTKTTAYSLGTFYPNMTWQLLPGEDVGTVITSNRPIAVFCIDTDGATPADNYWAQLTPTSSWGTEYILPALNTSSSSASFSATARIVTNHANTRVEIFGDFEAIKVLPERGDYLDQAIDPSVNYTIFSNFPIAIAVQYEEAVTGARSVLTVPTVDNFMDSPTIFYEALPGMAYFTDASGVASSATDSAVSCTSTGNRTLYDKNTITSFVMSIVNDFSDVQPGFDEVYNHPVRMSGHMVKDLEKARICKLTTGTPGDGIDNDCDGLIDEEDTCYTGYGSLDEDSDLDAAFGEDCLVAVPVSPAVPPPTIPMCYTLILPLNDSYCWSPCNCPCEWVDDLREYRNMTQEEKDATNLEKIKEYVAILQIDKTILSASVAEKESAEDARPSSTNIGISGIVLLTLICALIFCFDVINVVTYFKNLRRTSTT